MADEYSSKPQYPQYKTRSASISAPPSSSLEAIIIASEIEAPEVSTPNNRRRRPAARSQSARITGAKSVRKKVPQPPTFHDNKPQYTSEPYLSDEAEVALPQPIRRGSQRRTTQSNSSSYAPARRKSTATSAFLDVPGANFYNTQHNDDTVTLRTFSASNKDSPGDENISIILNGIESELRFITDNSGDKDQIDGCDAFLVIYSVVDKASFTRAEYFLSLLQDMDLLRSRCCILVGNKIDLARSRAISSQDGKCLACTYRAKFVEVSVGINHNVDELLAGTLTQIQLKKEHCELQGPKESSHSWYKSRNVVRASMKARQMITWIFGKEDSKFKNCENLQVL
ncbi:CLUMA_CG008695, isoform A [Clunio marinus]|uniref:CLUMA_CG008695, isoform A n=1 Tax=Clunio marinus TaxID=568069 RepID=A0A1J1I8W2_9DIPT|nr:CLUMA_CG008695, isoform A [Clunio marinus]